MVQTMEVPMSPDASTELPLKDGLRVSLSPFDTPEKITFAYDGARQVLSMALTYLTPHEPRTTFRVDDIDMDIGRDSGKLYLAVVERASDVGAALRQLIAAIEETLSRSPTPEPSVKDLNFRTVRRFLSDEQLQDSVERAFRQ